MNARKLAYLTAALVVLALLGALVVGWRYNGWDLAKTALLGDTVAPIVGVLSLVAVAAGLWSVRIQHEALELQRAASTQQEKSMNDQLELQRAASTEQQKSLNDQLELQRQELAHQREVLEIELRFRRHTALREVYVPFMATSAAYLDAVRTYLEKMQLVDGQVAGEIRRDWQRSCRESFEEFKRTYDSALLVDTNAERHEHRWPLSQEVHLEPWVDTKENQKDWADVLLNRILERTDHHVALRAALHKEFGAAVAQKDAGAKGFDQELRADLKKKADAVDDRIEAQLHELVKAEAVRSGRVPPDED